MNDAKLAQDRAVLRDVLRELRLTRGLRQSDVADRLGKPQSFLSKVETGERTIDVIELRSLCAALSISLEDVVAELEARLLEADAGPRPTERPPDGDGGY